MFIIILFAPWELPQSGGISRIYTVNVPTDRSFITRYAHTLRLRLLAPGSLRSARAPNQSAHSSYPSENYASFKILYSLRARLRNTHSQFFDAIIALSLQKTRCVNQFVKIVVVPAMLTLSFGFLSNFVAFYYYCTRKLFSTTTTIRISAGFNK